jgi:predicted ATP-grasp superfamily ATP-dependent carboligase
MIAAVTDVHLRSAVAGLRGLGRAGIEVLAVGPPGAAGLRSRYANARAVAPEPSSNPDGYVEALEAAAEKHGGLFVFPASEAGLEPLLRHIADLDHPITLPFGNVEAAARLRDKTELPALAAAVGLDTPAVVAVGDAGAIRVAAPRLPVVLKPATFPAGIATAQPAATEARLDKLLAKLHPHDRVIAQETVDGAPISLALVMDAEGKVVTCFQERAIRTWPAEAGSFAVTQSVAPDPGLTERARDLLRSVGYSGLAQFDLILTVDGPVLLDVNTRFYACLPNALRCGINLPAAWHAVARGQSFDAPSRYPEGVRYRWLEADLTAAFRGHPGRLLTVPRRGTAGAMWAADDPVPGMVLALGAFTVRAARRVRGK